MHTWGDPQLTPGARQQEQEEEEEAAQLKITNYPCKRWAKVQEASQEGGAHCTHAHTRHSGA